MGDKVREWKQMFVILSGLLGRSSTGAETRVEVYRLVVDGEQMFRPSKESNDILNLQLNPGQAISNLRSQQSQRSFAKTGRDIFFVIDCKDSI